jgi:hypothetical protein
MAVSDDERPGDGRFPATSWSLLRDLRAGSDDDQRARLLGRLIQLYWKPVFCVIQHSWARSNDDARDLTQQFFADAVLGDTLVERYQLGRGSFRAFLKGAVTKFMCATTRDAARKKRGGHLRAVSFDGSEDLELSTLVQDGQALSFEEVFDKAWNNLVLSRSLERLQQRLRLEGNERLFEILRRHDLDPDDVPPSYEALGRDCGLSAHQIKHNLTAARARLREVTIEIVREYTAGAEDLSLELQQLLGQ